MTPVLLTLPVALPLLAAGFTAALPRHARLRRTAALATTAMVLAPAAVLLTRTAVTGDDILTTRIGDWPAGMAIVFAADAFSALMLCTTALLVLVCLAFAAASGDDRKPVFAPLVLLCSGGTYGALLTADLFNLFVLLELMLMPSYVLLTMAGGRGRLTAGRIYVTISLLASTMLLAGLALVYGLTGTLNLGALAGAARDSAAVAAAGAVVLLALAVKAAVVPLHGWLPRTYPETSPVITALFSGLLTKVALFAAIRIYAVVYDGDRAHLWLLLAAAWLTMVVGVLGAVGESAMRPILVFHMVSQVGYVLLGPALFTTDGLAAAIFYLVQYVLVKTALLLCAGAVETAYGTGRLDGVKGLAAREPLLTAAFVTAALSLAGLPPMSGFVAKLGLLRATALEQDWISLTVATAVSLLTLLSMLKIWSAVFAGPPDPPEPAPHRSPAEAPRPARPGLVLPAAALAAFSLILGAGGKPLLDVAQVAAAHLTDPADWIAAVTSRAAGTGVAGP
ncbi:proton-conducting transporter membrane subunit [Streptomyces sp. YIM 98790]|uniref:proton-conducting transporter transmembrane domain-containing protein n=1 Tax=Streptomyces sp. YIM 98790 TaxID=2689077 RepID=UPI001408C998|nr:proton-conducting transporter membrane subunit [Streptomyces sp. YIM 98790]